MLGWVAHIGITVRDMETALKFYVEVLGMEKIGEETFAGEEASRLTQVPGTVLRAAYLRGGKEIKGRRSNCCTSKSLRAKVSGRPWSCAIRGLARLRFGLTTSIRLTGS